VALISEQGNRFSHKVRIAELTGFRRLAEHFGPSSSSSPAGDHYPPANEQGEYISVHPRRAIGASSTMTSRLSLAPRPRASAGTDALLFQMLAADPYMRPQDPCDVLKVFGRKNPEEYMYTEQELQQMMAQQQAQEELSRRRRLKVPFRLDSESSEDVKLRRSGSRTS